MNVVNTCDAAEIAKFDQLFNSWWDLEGELKTLHRINPVRLQFITEKIDLNGLTVLDIGCGGGILAESLARCGAKVTAIDLSHPAIEVAKKHAVAEDLTIDYQHISLENFAAKLKTPFDCVVSMELLEHVNHPDDFIKTMSQVIKPNGELFLSTINRTLKAYGLAILAAEYVLRLLPKKTHDYEKFIRPAELCQWLRNANIEVSALQGMSYNPFNEQAQLCSSLDINYLVHARKLFRDHS